MMTNTCVPKALSSERAALARARAIELNPSNAAPSRQVLRTPAGRRGGPKRLVLVTGNRWPVTGVRLTVSFLDNPPADLRKRIVLHMNAWQKTANIAFTETRGVGQVRIARLTGSRDGGFWSYVGTEILGVDDDEPTMNLEGFTMSTSEGEFRRVVRHEAGHTLGFDHEHMRGALVDRINRRKAFAFYERTQGWSRQETLEQVLTPLSEKSVMGTTEADPLSIMCYHVPATITKNGKAIAGGRDINAVDYRFAASVYPKRVSRATKSSAKRAKASRSK
ncbi:MAG: M12 family metallopeptidase [Vicinamibacterales bacterium]